MTNLSAMVITIDKEEVENVPENLGIGAGVSFKSVCFDFFLHQHRQLSNRNPNF